MIQGYAVKKQIGTSREKTDRDKSRLVPIYRDLSLLEFVMIILTSVDNSKKSKIFLMVTSMRSNIKSFKTSVM